MFTNTYGISPSNTTLTVRYLTGGGVASNVPSGDLTTLNTRGVYFNNPNLSSTTANDIFTSLVVSNPFAASGGQDGDGIEEIRKNLAKIDMRLMECSSILTGYQKALVLTQEESPETPSAVEFMEYDDEVENEKG